jgi:hypothetical protein
LRRARIKVSQVIEVYYDPEKFSEEWMKDFRSYMYDFYDVEDHLEHLAQMYARGLIHDVSSMQEAEGYGNLLAMRTQIHDDPFMLETEILDDEEEE